MRGRADAATATLLGALLLSTAGCQSNMSAPHASPQRASPPAAYPPAASTAEASTADASDTSPRALQARLVGLLSEGRFVELDAIADQLRTQRLRFKGGAWRLHVFYATVSFPGSAGATDADWQAHIEKLKRWVESAPASPTARAALAQGYLRFAWKARGNGYADTVTAEGWRLFAQRVQLARSVLDDAANLGIRDPGTFRQMQTVALAQQWHRDHFDTLTNEAMSFEPGYFYFALAEANYLLPKWYGQPGDSEKYAADEADKLGGSEGAELYFRIAAHLNCCKGIQAPAMSWPRVQDGFAQIERLYGATNRQLNVMAYLALGAHDSATAQALFARIGDDWDAHVWKTRARFDAARKGLGPAAETSSFVEDDPEI